MVHLSLDSFFKNESRIMGVLVNFFANGQLTSARPGGRARSWPVDERFGVGKGFGLSQLLWLSFVEAVPSLISCGTKTGQMRVGMFRALGEVLLAETSSSVEEWEQRFQEAAKAKASPKLSAHEASSRISSFLVALCFWDWFRVVSKS